MPFRKSVFAVALLIHLTPLTSYAEVKYLGAIGDSITAGSMAETDLGKLPLSVILNGGLSESKDRFSWATGQDPVVNSHFRRLQDWEPKTQFRYYNAAKDRNR